MQAGLVARSILARFTLPYALLFAIASALPAAGAVAEDAPVFTFLGEDPAGDDLEEFPLSAGPRPEVNLTAADLSDIDDLVGLSVATVGTSVVFRVTVGDDPTAPENATGQFCWAPVFRVNEGDLQYVALVCGNFTKGQFDQFVPDDSGLGPEVASGGEFQSEARAVLITVPLANISAELGDSLTGIYAITYVSASLYLDDVAPDASTNATAPQTFPDYVIGTQPEPVKEPAPGISLSATETRASATAGERPTFQFTVSNSGNAQAKYSFAAHGLQPGFQASFSPASADLAPDGEKAVTVTVTIPIGAKAGVYEFQVEVSVGELEGTLSYRLDVVAASGGSGAPKPTPTPVEDPEDVADEDGGQLQDEPTKKKTPGLGAVLVLVGLAAGAVGSRRR